MNNSNFTSYFQSNKNLEYQYLTNIYDIEEPPGMVSISSPSTSTTTMPLLIHSTSINYVQNNSGLDYTYVNQDILDGDDIVFVLPSNTTQLCFDPSLTGKLDLYKSGFTSFSSTNNFMYSNGSNLVYNTVDFVSNCLTIPAAAGTFVYCNFNCKVIDPTLKTARFEISWIKDSKSESRTFSVPVNSLYHDPNYLELECVWEEDGGKYAKYHVECYNDQSGAVNDVDFTLTLPTGAIPSTVNILDWKISCDEGCGESNKLTKSLNGYELYVDFNSSLDDLDGLSPGDTPQDKHKAWFDFCVKLDNSVNIYTDPLQPTNPFTTFYGFKGPLKFPIVHFVDHTTCLPSDAFPDKCEENFPENRCHTIRSNTEKCSDCACKIKKKNWFQRLFD
ncbi:MAG: hypothetical protein KDC16_11705 [Saprospiraceae bacterium]|nr:hypothetical protein [Saprospiraceae bacterium]